MTPQNPIEYPPHQSAEYFAKKFDTDLVEQIISLELDTAIRTLAEDRGICVNRDTENLWKDALRKSWMHMAVEESSRHTFCPSAFEQFLRRILEDLIDAEYGEGTAHVDEDHYPQPTFSLFTRFLVFCRKAGDKKMHP